MSAVPGALSDEVFNAISLLIPSDAVGCRKRRIGRNGDGGYVLLDLLDCVDIVYSFGISIENSFDSQIAAAGKKVFMYDHTISRPPAAHANCTYFKKGIGPIDEPDKLLYSLETLCADNGHSAESRMLLKMDVEGAELEVFAHGDGSFYQRFSQITFELHWLSKLAEPVFRSKFTRALENLLNNFALVHVHANNNRPVVNVGGFLIPDVVEVTFVRKGLVQLQPSKTVYPTGLDFPNNSSKPEIVLWFYPFSPGSCDIDKFSASLGSANRSAIAVALSKGSQAEAELAKTRNKVASLEAELASARAPITDQQRRRSNPLRILYMGFHDVLAYDDIGMFSRLGFRVCPIKAFAKSNDASALRTLGAGWVDEGLRALYVAEGLSEKFISNFDIAIYTHFPGEDISDLFEKLGSMPIVYRTIGQCTNTTEADLNALRGNIKVVRYSESEVVGLNARNTDAVIPFSKDSKQFTVWRDGSEIVTFHNHYARRKLHSTPMLSDYEKITRSLDAALYGDLNDGLAAARGLISPQMQMEVYATAAVYLYVHTVPTSYTLNFIEALAVGCPIVVPSADYIMRPASREARDKGVAIGRNNFVPGRYDLENLVAGRDCIFDSAEEAVGKIQALLENKGRRVEISKYQRDCFQAKFDESVVAPMWQQFLFDFVNSN